MGLNEGWISASNKLVTEKAWAGPSKQVDGTGAVYNTCIGTRATCRDSIAYFLNRPTKVDDPHAFGPVILAAVELSKIR